MKQAVVLFTLLLAGVSLQTSCGGSNPSNPNPGPTPTATNTPLPVGIVYSVSGSTYQAGGLNAPLTTIAVGTSAVWDSSNSLGHTLYISSAGTGTCFLSTSSFPVTYDLSAGTYQFHCSVHSPCGTGSCNSCSGMAATLIVQ